MRKFTCNECKHEWEIPHGTGMSGRETACPSCGSSNIHRVDGVPPRGRCARGMGGRGFGKGCVRPSGN